MRSPYYLIILLFFTSCSLFSERATLLGENKSEVKEEFVSKKQYDDLLKRYESLKLQTSNQIVEKTQNVPAPVEKDLPITPPDEVINQLANIKPTAETTVVAETVDAFGHTKVDQIKNKKEVVLPKTVINHDVIDEKEDFTDADQFINDLEQAKILVTSKRYPEALELIKKLDKVKIKQVKVRAKFLMGELMLSQGEYDLAMQSYEEIITKYSFSGLVLSALKQLEICTEKLKLDQKKQKYHSLTYDVFGV